MMQLLSKLYLLIMKHIYPTDGEGKEERPEVSKWLESNLFPRQYAVLFSQT